jgi:hypothetical protein
MPRPRINKLNQHPALRIEAMVVSFSRDRLAVRRPHRRRREPDRVLAHFVIDPIPRTTFEEWMAMAELERSLGRVSRSQ